MTKLLERFDIEDDLYIYLQNNSKRWYARVKIAGKWISKATKEKDKEKAIGKAYHLKMQADNNLLVSSKRFRDVASQTVAKLQHALDAKTGKAIYKNYIQILNKYHIPYFDRTYITSIDSVRLKAFDVWRANEMGRKPAKSTLLSHNAAMQMVFKEAVENKWMLVAQVPDLSTAGGEATQRRAHFTPQEYEFGYEYSV